MAPLSKQCSRSTYTEAVFFQKRQWFGRCDRYTKRRYLQHVPCGVDDGADQERALYLQGHDVVDT